MTTVRLFAAAAEAAGTTELVLQVPTLTALKGCLLEQAPPLAAVLPRCSFLVDGLQAHGDPDLSQAGVVDVLPPFAGG